jgi:hypothetical protein
MARKVLVRLVDDLDGLPSEGVATVTFSLDGVTYQIDLNEANASKLRDGLADFVAAGRRIGGRIKRGSAAGGRSAGSGDGPAIREWAREQGHELAERGRIPSHIVDAFHAANRGGRAVKAAKAPANAPMKAAAASKTAVAKATATAGRAAKGARPATTKATKAPATKATPARAATKSTTKATAAKATGKTTAAAAKATPAKAATAKPAAKTGAAKAPAAKAPRATKSTVTAKASTRGGRTTRKTES